MLKLAALALSSATANSIPFCSKAFTLNPGAYACDAPKASLNQDSSKPLALPL